jgi:nitrogen fixation/metabolism regulation signal transduction histidine kinase
MKLSDKSSRWALLAALVATTAIALLLGFLLSITGVSQIDESNFFWLFWLNVALAALLLLAVAIAAVRLALRYRSGKFGSRLLFKLAGIFALVGLAPGLLIYTVSYQFVSRSIEDWFDVRVAGALDAGLALGRSTLDAMAADLAAKARLTADRLAETTAPIGPLALERVREQLAVGNVSLIGPAGQVLATAGGSAIVTERPSALMLRQARTLRVASQIEGLDDEPAPGTRLNARVRALALMPNVGISLSATEERFLMVVQPLPPQLVGNALAVQGAYREYQERAISRVGLRRMYIGTLTLALVLVVFGAVLLAAALGHQIARPLLVLAEGVREVAEGNLAARPVFASRDELGGLTRDFAKMTEQLADARAQVQRGVAQLEGTRTRLQTILDSLTAGVVLFDREQRIDTVNPGATRILHQPLSAYRGRRLNDVPGLDEFAQGVWQRFELHRVSPEAGERHHWQDAFELKLADQVTLNLLVRGAVLPNDARLMVFDDITEVVSAQRSVAWAEVARRLAHEIKNPLTPIQLSAERLQAKLQSKLKADDRVVLERSVATIVAQVQAMKQLVDEFRDYARLPAAQLAPLDLNALIAEVLALYDTALEQGLLHADLAQDLPLIQGDATQLRQVVHNLVQNSLDAVADRPNPHVHLRTELARDTSGAAKAVRLTVIDNGPGFSESVLQRAFEPYVTTKAKGSGLGLAVVRKIADEHHARVRIGNLRAGEQADNAVMGAQVSLSFSSFAAAPSTRETEIGEQRNPVAAAGDTTKVH